MPAHPFLSTKPFEASHPDALAIYCSDGRFTDAVEELLHGLGHPRLDTLTMPGGAALFNAWLAGMSESMAITRAARFLIEAHATKRAILVAHEGCGYYKKHYADATPTAVRDHQEHDLRHAAGHLREYHPEVAASLYVAVLDKGRVKFEPVG